MRRTPKLVVVTGAGSGIGRATVLRFAGNGATVIAADIDADTADETAKLVADAGGRAHGHVVDVSDAAAMTAFAEDVETGYGVPDVVVNNAGFTTAGSFLDHTPADWERLIGVNVYGVIHGCRLFGAQMMKRGRGGQLINIASGAAYIPIPLSSPYCTTKSAVLMLSQCLRVELAGHRIGVTAVCPGIIDSGFLDAAQHLAVEQAEVERRRVLSNGLAAFVASSPDAVARAIVRSVPRNPAILPVTAESKAGYVLSRVSPGLLRAGARFAVLDRVMRMADQIVPQRIQRALVKRGAR